MTQEGQHETAGSIVATGSSAAGMLAMLHGAAPADMDVPKPFGEPILLVEQTRVSTRGESVYGFDGAVVPEEGETLRFVRDPSNLHDRWSIRVEDGDGHKVGYVGADVNQILARLMDAGKHVYGKVVDAVSSGNWHRVEMAVYLDD